ncbi:MAG: hypothetical protein ACPG5B_13120 [Chitinophagales bacterium]
MIKTSFFSCISILCLCFFVLAACNEQATQQKLLLKTWKLNDAKEGQQPLFSSTKGTTFRFMNESKIEIKRTYRGKSKYLRGNWAMNGSKMRLQLLESENFRVIYDLSTKEASEEQFISKNATSLQIDFEIEKLEKFVLKLKNDSLQYILVPNF